MVFYHDLEVAHEGGEGNRKKILILEHHRVGGGGGGGPSEIMNILSGLF